MRGAKSNALFSERAIRKRDRPWVALVILPAFGRTSHVRQALVSARPKAALRPLNQSSMKCLGQSLPLAKLAFSLLRTAEICRNCDHNTLRLKEMAPAVTAISVGLVMMILSVSAIVPMIRYFDRF